MALPFILGAISRYPLLLLGHSCLMACGVSAAIGGAVPSSIVRIVLGPATPPRPQENILIAMTSFSSLAPQLVLLGFYGDPWFYIFVGHRMEVET